MSLEAVARKDFEDAVRSRWLLALSAFFVLLVALAVYLAPSEATSTQVLNSLVVRDFFVTMLIPLIGLVIAYNAVVGERESGSLKLLLSLPHSRADVVFGKVVGRSTALATPIAVGFLLPALSFLATPVTFQLGSYLGFIILTVLLGAAFVSIAVGFSAAMSSQRLAIGGAVGLYLLFVPLWGVVQFPLKLYLGFSGVPSWLPITGQELFLLLRLINPTGSFKIVSGAYLSGQLFAGGGQAVQMQLAAVAMLIAWLLIPPLLGLWRFEQADL